MGHARRIKTEHAGAKNGGGFWGSRFDAKKMSNRARREVDKKTAAESNGSEPSDRVD